LQKNGDKLQSDWIACPYTLIASKCNAQRIYGILNMISKVNIFSDGLQKIGLLPVAEFLVIRFVSEINPFVGLFEFIGAVDSSMVPTQ
jgi:hypothetical protein